MQTKIKILIIPILFLFTLNSCFYDMWVEGDGEVTEEVRTVPEFVSIHSSGSFNIYYEYAEDPEVIVSCESNLLMYVETFVQEGELKIRTPYNVNIRPHHTIEVFVKGPYVDEITLSGSGLIHTEEIYSDYLQLKTSGSGHIETTFYGKELKTILSGSGIIDTYAECDYLEAIISGSGRVNLEGTSERAYYKISGSGKFDGYDFPVNDLEILISGSGSMYVNVEESLSGKISGSGNIYYLGTPAINITTTGSGNIISEN